jgi:hypothetical protein
MAVRSGSTEPLDAGTGERVALPFTHSGGLPVAIDPGGTLVHLRWGGRVVEERKPLEVPAAALAWLAGGELGQELYQVIDVERGAVLRSVPWSARPMAKGQFHGRGGTFRPTGDRVLVGCAEYLTLLGLGIGEEQIVQRR